MASSRFAPLPGWFRASAAAGLCAVALAGTGCLFGGKTTATKPGAANANVPATDRYKVVAETTPFYRYGPQQPSGPDQTLKKNTEVTMVSRAYGYSRVKTPDGETGYVGTEDITQLTAEDIADENAALQQTPTANAQTPLGPGEGGGYTIPPEAGNNERLPMPDSSPSPKPSLDAPFRY